MEKSGQPAKASAYAGQKCRRHFNLVFFLLRVLCEVFSSCPLCLNFFVLNPSMSQDEAVNKSDNRSRQSSPALLQGKTSIPLLRS